MPTDPVQRRLAAILAADVAGYSRLMGEDEEGTRARFNALLDGEVHPAIAKHEGRLVKTMGDGFLVEFASVVNAMQCAADIQAGARARAAGDSEDQRMALRIGVHLGDVMVEGDDIHGNGVNIAARLEALAEPGGICVTDMVHAGVRGKLALDFADLGEQSLKNIAEPVRVYQVVLGSPWQDGTSATDAIFHRPAVAVLPFENLSGDPEQEYFADGLTEDIITALSLWRSFPVIARNSSFAYKGTAPDIRRVGKELGARYVIEGSVRRSENRMRVTAQLISAETGHQIWAERYDREIEDVFALQDEIADSIVGRIDTEVRTSEMDRARRKRPTNLDAWELYQRGMWHAYKVTKADNEAAHTLFLKAVERDPNFAVAYAGIAFSCHLAVFHEFVDNPTEWLAKGLAAGEKAVALDDRDGFSHFVLGRLLALEGQGDRAIAELEKSVSLNPSFAQGFLGLAHALNWCGRPAEAIPNLDRAMQLSPYDPLLWGMQGVRAVCCINLENYAEGEEWARKSINARPDQLWSHISLVVALVGQDRMDEARLALDAVRRVNPNLSLSVVRRLRQRSHPKFLERRIDALRKAGLPE